MSNKSNWKLRFQFASLGAIAYGIPVVFYIRDTTYRETWLLFLGVFFFLVVAIIHTLLNGRKRNNIKTFRLVFDSFVITIMSIVITCILCFTLMVILIPGYLGNGPAAKVLADNPSNDVFDKTNGMSLKIFMTAIIGNFSAGTFVGILVPFYASRVRGKTLPEAALEQ